MSDDGKFRCPSCSGMDIRHSLPRGPLDTIMQMFHMTPFRCRRCERRFYSTHARTQEEIDADHTTHEHC